MTERKRKKKKQKARGHSPHSPPAHLAQLASEAGPACQGQGRLQPLPSGRGVARMPPRAATSCLPQGLHVPFSTPGEGPRSPLPFFPLAHVSPFVSGAPKSRTRNPSRRPSCPDVATQPLQPRHRVLRLQRRRLRRFPKSIELKPLGIRRQLHRGLAGPASRRRRIRRPQSFSSHTTTAVRLRVSFCFSSPSSWSPSCSVAHSAMRARASRRHGSPPP